MSLMSLGLVRGLVAQALGTLVGMAVVTLIRIAAGMPAWAEEPAWVVGMLTGGIAFMVGVGAMGDWMKWWRGIETPMQHGPPHGVPTWARYFGVDYNHKVIGIQYGVTALIMLMIGGGFAVIFRTELARSGLQFLDPSNYNTLISLHGWAALFSILLGVGGMANYVVPLMLGAEDMAFPRLNACAFWINVPALVLLLSTIFFGGWDGGWGRGCAAAASLVFSTLSRSRSRARPTISPGSPFGISRRSRAWRRRSLSWVARPTVNWTR